jgi:hypothetical protein
LLVSAGDHIHIFISKLAPAHIPYWRASCACTHVHFAFRYFLFLGGTEGRLNGFPPELGLNVFPMMLPRLALACPGGVLFGINDREGCAFVWVLPVFSGGGGGTAYAGRP